ERSAALALPKVRVTRPASTIALFASSTRSRSSECAITGRPSETAGQMVVRLVPAEIPLEVVRPRALVDHEQLEAGDPGEVGHHLDAVLRRQPRVVRAAGD